MALGAGPCASVAFKRRKAVICGTCKSETIFKLNGIFQFDIEGIIFIIRNEVNIEMRG